MGAVTKVVIVVVIVVVSASIHEVMHGFVALDRGDRTAADRGRLSLNPLVHIDPFNTILLPLILFFTVGFAFGGAKPVPVNVYNLRNPERDFAWVAIAGPLTNLSLAVLGILVWAPAYYLFAHVMPLDGLHIIQMVIMFWVIINVLLAMFNLIPLPPLDGSRVFRLLLPRDLRMGYDSIERFGFLPILALWYFGSRMYGGAFRAWLYLPLRPFQEFGDFLGALTGAPALPFMH